MHLHQPIAQQNLTSAEATAVAAFVSGVNAGDLATVLDLFAADAHVNDQLRNFWGIADISDWLEREIVGEHIKVRVRSMVKHYDVVILDADMSGDFVGSGGVSRPVDVDLYFSIQDNKIVRLLVLLAPPDAAEPEVRRHL